MDSQNNNYSSTMKTMKTMKLLSVATFLLTFTTLTAFSQIKVIDEKYLKIKPFISTKEDVEKIFGASGSSNHIVVYKENNKTVTVIYSYGDCNSGSKEWGVPEWTVEEVSYVWQEKAPRLKSILFDLSIFKKKQIGDVIGQIKYFNHDIGIAITYLRNEKTANDLTIYPTLEQRKKVACSPKEEV